MTGVQKEDEDVNEISETVEKTEKGDEVTNQLIAQRYQKEEHNKFIVKTRRQKEN